MLGSADDAEDVLQSVWISAFHRPPDGGPDSNVRAWLYRVATNAALDRLADARRRRVLLDARDPRLAPDPAPRPDTVLAGLGDAARTRVRESVARLPRKQREAVWLRWVEGADYATVAEKLGSTLESARANVHHGLKRLRSELADVWNQEDRR